MVMLSCFKFFNTVADFIRLSRRTLVPVGRSLKSLSLKSGQRCKTSALEQSCLILRYQPQSKGKSKNSDYDNEAGMQSTVKYL